MKAKCNKVCAQCIHSCKQPEWAILMNCPKFKKPMVTWSCLSCEAKHEIDYITSKRILHCTKCRAIHKVVRYHRDGSPILRLYATIKNGRKGQTVL